MNFMQRAFLYCLRHKGKTLILFLVMTVISTFLLAGLAIRDASADAASDVQTAIGGRLLLEIETEGNYKFVGQDGGTTTYVYGGDYITSPIIDAVSEVDGVVGYNVEDAAAAYYAGVNFKYLPSGWNFGFTKYGDHSTFTACLSSERCSAFESGRYSLVEGRHLKPEDSYAILISKELADYNNLSVGDIVTIYDQFLDSEGWNPLIDMEIVGIFNGTEGTATGGEMLVDQLQANCGFVAYNTLFEMYKLYYENGVEYHSLTIYIKDPTKIQNVYDKVKELPELKGKTLKLSMDTEEYQTVETPLETLGSLVNAMLVIIVIVGFLILVLLLMIWIRGRKKEIGIYLAVGRSKVSIAGQLFAETGIAALIAFAVSVLGSNLWMGKVRELLEGSAADLEIEISAAYLPPVFLIGIGLIAAATLAASWTVFRLKPRDIFSKMS